MITLLLNLQLLSVPMRCNHRRLFRADRDIRENDLAAKTERSETARRLERDIEAICVRLEELTDRPTLSPSPDNTSQAAWDAAFEAHDNKVEQALGKGASIASSLDQQIEALGRILLELTSMKQFGIPNNIQTTEHTPSVLANGPGSQGSVSSLAIILNLLTMALTTSSATFAYRANKAAPQASQTLQPSARGRMRTFNGTPKTAQMVNSCSDKTDATSTNTESSTNQIANNSYRLIPKHPIFLAMIEPLAPDFNIQPVRHDSNGCWVPPNTFKAYMQGDTATMFFRWTAGLVNFIPADDRLRRAKHIDLVEYRTASVFTQYPGTSRVLALPFDARAKNASHYSLKWHPIRFDHIEVRKRESYFSSISTLGAEPVIAAPGSPSWIPQLLPSVYDCYDVQSQRKHAGLVGDLPLLLALAAFSAPPTKLKVLKYSLQPNKWAPHQYPNGRTWCISALYIQNFC